MHKILLYSMSSLSFGEKWKISPPVEEQLDEPSEIELTERSSNQLSKLLMLQFAIDQMALEVIYFSMKKMFLHT